MNITIRPAKKKDIPDIHALVMELAIYEKEPESFSASIETYHKDFEDSVFEALVAETENTIVGMALYYMAYSTWKGKMLFLEDFIIRDEYRKQGIGQKLFDAFLQTAREKGCQLVKWQVLDWNEPALKFYQKNRSIIESNWWNGKIYL